ncbi:MAG: 5-methyltetrahydropteroyltriglutamate--homocysteine S-methyltransferase [Arenicellales bacterium]|nr:5-methyltetrahydropteroyltriglutamate--homocysteine S-methyltransferase [Arenicellales bacterium]
MATPKPVFRADHVGSLLRPKAVKDARKARFEKGTIDTKELARVEDEAICTAVDLQQAVGLKAVTDGEYRRSFWHYDFLEHLTGFKLVERDKGFQFHGANLRPVYPVISGMLDFPSDHPMLKHYSFLASVARGRPKISIPGPSCCHFRTAPEDIDPIEYRDQEVLFSDITRAYAKAVKAFYDAGCRYLQMDDIFFAYLCDPKIRAEKQSQGVNPDWLVKRYAAMMHDAIKDRPDDMTIAMHLCRGNFQSTWVATGAYDPVAEAVFTQTGIDVFFLEYDSDRAGGLEPLRLLPTGNQRVMAGFVTTKSGKLETVDELCRKFDAASKYADLDQLGIAPQCGFASTEEGNKLSEDQQKQKLELLVKTAEKIWGEVG